MKKITIFASIIGSLLLINTTPAHGVNFAENRIDLPKSTTGNLYEKRSGIKLNPSKSIASLSGEKKDAIANTKIEKLKNKAGEEITRRITSLSNIINKIQAIKRLTDSQKSSLISDIQAEITSLTSLNTKIQADTDIETLRADVKSIVTSYRTYLLYMPKTRIIIAANGILNTADILTEFVEKLQTRINEAKNAGKDTSNLEALLADMQVKIAQAKTNVNNAIDAVSQLKPTDFPGNKPSLQNARTLLADALKALQTAKQDAQKIVVELKNLNKTNKKTPEASQSASPTNIIPTSSDSTQSAK